MSTFRFKNNKGQDCSLFYGLSGYVNKCRAHFEYVSYAGTTLTLDLFRIMQSKQGRDLEQVMTQTDFVFLLKPDEIWREWEKFLDLSDCDSVRQDSELMKKVAGRLRLTYRTIMEIKDDGRNKAIILKDAINASYNIHLKSVTSQLRETLQEHSDKEHILETLVKMAMMQYFTNEDVVFTEAELEDKPALPFDFVNAGVATLHRNPETNEYDLSVKEPMAMQAILTVISEHKNSLSDVCAYYHASLLCSTISNSTKAQAKGNIFNTITAASMLKKDSLWNMIKDTSIKVEAPTDEPTDVNWIKELKFFRYGNCNAFDCKSDIEVLRRVMDGTLDNIILLPDQFMGYDALGINRVNDKFRIVGVGCKLLGKNYKKKYHSDTIVNISQINIDQQYYKHRDSTSEVHNLNQHNNFHDFKILVEKQLLISAILPQHPDVHYKTLAAKEGAIVVKLDETNYQSLITLPYARSIIALAISGEKVQMKSLTEDKRPRKKRRISDENPYGMPITTIN
jgi:hypothetical protein